MNHSFNVDVAQKYGVDGAILIENMYFWISKNKANNTHFYEGEYWTYNSVKAFSELFPYWTSRQIERILKHLEAEEVIKIGNFNTKGYDRTKWYTLTDSVKRLYVIGEIHSTKRLNAIPQTVEPIPDINTDINTDTINISKRFKIPTLEEVKNYCKERGNSIDPEQFCDFYESKGWMVGKNKMKSWQASVRYWEKNQKSTPKPTPNKERTLAEMIALSEAPNVFDQ